MRSVLHIDMNACYASIECLYDPSIRNLPVAVGGDVEASHGIILATNQIAKRFGVKTGEALWQAKQKCPELHIVPPHFDRYLRFSRMAREIYADYTDLVEPFGPVSYTHLMAGDPSLLFHVQKGLCVGIAAVWQY